jgi:serine/threonine-protein kinase
LLQRIGRIAHDKAVDIARGIASGLMAAHAKGILHRDLKPANVMIDSRGEARIMDFGLALTTGEHDGTISGTPAYMAPELFDNEPPSVQSDLYALGLVMYELFTGRRVHNARTMPERLRDLTSDITTPSSVVRDIDPAVERVILRCLEQDPAQRPRSARMVVDALPGGDALAAALAAGETPSPRIVAAAGTEGTLRPALAWGLLSVAAALMATLFLFTRAGGYLRMTVAPAPLEVQAARAGDLLRTLGIPRQEFETHGLQGNSRYSAWIFTHDVSPRRWERLRHGLPMVTFWMREDSEPVLDSRPGAQPRPDLALPPQVIPGSVAVRTDARGRLFALAAIPSSDWQSRPLRWDALLSAAGLSAAALRSEPSRTTPPSFADARAAWSGRHPEDGTPIHVEAAAYRGVPVFFQITAPWDEVDTRDQVPFGGGGRFSFDMAMSALLLAAIGLAALLAWRNLNRRRGDRAGAARLGMAVFAASFLKALLIAEHELTVGHELRLFLIAFSQGLAWGVGLALGYLALEPFLRKRWPDKLISWARLISGNWRDPMIGRDVLIGIAAGLTHGALAALSQKAGALITGRSMMPFSGAHIELLDSLTMGFGHIADSIVSGILVGLAFMILVVFLSILLRRRSVAIGGLFVIQFALYTLASRQWWMSVVFVLLAALYTFILARFGLLAMAATHMTFAAIFFYPLPDAAAWYTPRGLTAVVFILALALWAFRTSLGGQRAFAVKFDD